MAVSVTITFPNNAEASDVADALATRWGYNAATDGTRQEFLKSKMIAWMRSEYREHKRNTAAAAAGNAAATTADGVSVT